MNPLEATEYEIKVIQQFASQDETRPHMCNVYVYRSGANETKGRTYVATDGYVIVIRRSGTHRVMSYYDIHRIGHDVLKSPPRPLTDPPLWQHVMKPGLVNDWAKKRS